MQLKVFVVVTLLGISCGQISDTIHSYRPPIEAARKFSFGYAVEHASSRVNYNHEAKSDGKVVKGVYYVDLPDGRIQRVEYRADKNGYEANVDFHGVAEHPVNYIRHRQGALTFAGPRK
ncbi:unnamed protein product [Meganyctiphanes norvegica]|uniref:Cuticle protein n=1 Tax=Meganyctiphanes norvegica TaxID=48144 RepID=A0AAV2QM51_MEGNR